MKSYSEQKPLRMMEIRNRAKMLGVQVSLGMSRNDLIHQIQINEGNRDCFKTDVLECQQLDCCWYNECQER
jgi:hypothetical protein